MPSIRAVTLVHSYTDIDNKIIHNIYASYLVFEGYSAIISREE